jgi:hypothetical protein
VQLQPEINAVLVILLAEIFVSVRGNYFAQARNADLSWHRCAAQLLACRILSVLKLRELHGTLEPSVQRLTRNKRLSTILTVCWRSKNFQDKNFQDRH